MTNIAMQQPTSHTTHTVRLMLGLPFDLARANYANAVRFGLLEHSLLKSARFGRDICAIERLALGPWARCV